MISLAIKPESIQVNQIKTTETDLTLEFVDGRTLNVPLTWYPRLLHGTVVERQTFELLDEGRMIHWLLLDEDLTVAGILAGERSGESQESLQKWLDSRAVH